jgi:hypothetical protein
MKRFILSVCAVAVAAATLFATCRNTEQKAELFTDNVEALAAPEITIGAICMSQPNAICIWVWPDEVYATWGIFI